MSWNEVVIEVSRKDADSLSDCLLEAGAISVSVEDADEGTDEEQPIFGEPGIGTVESAWKRSRIVALLEAAADPFAIIREAANASGLNPPPFTTRPVAEQDWVRLTQSQFDPIHIGKNIWVVPSWHETPDNNGIVLELDPGLAFGTGSHPTTRLCMEWLETHCREGMSVLDYGCGSGILAIVAKKLGAVAVDGVDIDPQAILSARHNASRNHCDVSFFPPEQFALTRTDKRYDIVVANILSGPLQQLAPMLAGRLASGGLLLLSGILERQEKEVAKSYAPFLEMSVWKEQDGWVALFGQLALKT